MNPRPGPPGGWTRLAVDDDKARDAIAKHRSEAELAAAIERSAGAQRPGRFRRLTALALRLRGRGGS
jgi:hypothetical protein